MHRAANSRLNCISLFLALVGRAGPKEAFQAVFAASRHNVDMQMRHALADAIVNRYKRPVRIHRRLDGEREKLGILKERRDQLLGQITQGFVVLFRNQEAMAGKNGTMIEKGQRCLIFKNQSGNHLPADDLAERTTVGLEVQCFALAPT